MNQETTKTATATKNETASKPGKEQLQAIQQEMAKLGIAKKPMQPILNPTGIATVDDMAEFKIFDSLYESENLSSGPEEEEEEEDNDDEKEDDDALYEVGTIQKRRGLTRAKFMIRTSWAAFIALLVSFCSLAPRFLPLLLLLIVCIFICPNTVCSNIVRSSFHSLWGSPSSSLPVTVKNIHKIEQNKIFIDLYVRDLLLRGQIDTGAELTLLSADLVYMIPD